MTDTHEHDQQAPQTRPAKLNLALAALMDELADDVLVRIPVGAPNSAEHVTAYTAMRSTLAAIDGVMTALPAVQDFRATVLAYVNRTWELTSGDPARDTYVERALLRAKQDYLPVIPEQLRRLGVDAADPQAPSAPKAKKAAK